MRIIAILISCAPFSLFAQGDGLTNASGQVGKPAMMVTATSLQVGTPGAKEPVPARVPTEKTKKPGTKSAAPKVATPTAPVILAEAPKSSPYLEILPERVFALPEFYHLEKGIKVPLVPAPKIAFRISATEKADAVTALTHILGPESVEQLGYWAPVDYAVSFSAKMNQSDYALALSRAARVPGVSATPIFMIEGQEAVVGGVVLETKTPVSEAFIHAELKKVFGPSGIMSIVPQGPRWHVQFGKPFFLDDTTMPLHVLSFANIAETSEKFPWLRAAYPSWIYLTEPVSVYVNATPPTGTIGEPRELILTIVTRRSGITIDERKLPRFGQGEFIPVSGGSAPQNGFVSYDKDMKKETEQDEVRGVTIYRFRTGFKLLAPEEEWFIPSVYVRYSWKGKEHIVQAQPAKLFVLPHGTPKRPILDMPLPLAATRPVLGAPGSIQGVSPSREAADLNGLKDLARYGGAFLAGLALLFWLNSGIRLVYGAMRREGPGETEPTSRITRHSILLDLSHDAGFPADKEGFRRLEDTLWAILALRFPRLRDDVRSVHRLKEIAASDKDMSQSLPRSTMSLIEEVNDHIASVVRGGTSEELAVEIGLAREKLESLIHALFPEET